jgi:hypothetical protein
VLLSRIVSQCNTADFKLIEHLANSQDERVGASLKPKQRLALAAVFAFTKIGLTFEEIYTIKEILFWDDGRWEYRFHHVPAARAVYQKLAAPGATKAIAEAMKSIVKK